jgi:hypothetical protein
MADMVEVEVSSRRRLQSLALALALTLPLGGCCHTQGTTAMPPWDQPGDFSRVPVPTLVVSLVTSAEQAAADRANFLPAVPFAERWKVPVENWARVLEEITARSGPAAPLAAEAEGLNASVKELPTSPGFREDELDNVVRGMRKLKDICVRERVCPPAPGG